MPRGSALIWQSSLPYHLISPLDGTVSYIALNFDFTYEHFAKNYPIPPDTENDFKPDNVLERVDFIDLPIFNEIVHVNDMEIIESDLLEIENEFESKKRCYGNKASGLFLKVLTEITRRTVYISSFDKGCKIDFIIKYIHSHYNEALSNTKIGELFNFHPNYINHLMVLHTGLSLHQYLLSYRISKAIYLLETTDMQISEIAYTVGFNDICHFSRYFRKRTGRKPQDFKEH